MTRTTVIVAAAIVLTFAGITATKMRSGDKTEADDPRPADMMERAAVQRFWELYRSATEHRMAGRSEDAARDYARALELNREHEDALYYLGNMHLELGEFTAAEQAWQRLVTVNPHSARGHLRLGDLFFCAERPEIFDIEMAEVEFMRALEINKEETGPLLRLGQLALVLDDIEGARRYFEAVLGSNYASVEAHFLSGYIAWKQGDSDRAHTLFETAVQYARPEKSDSLPAGEGDTRIGRAMSRDGMGLCSFAWVNVDVVRQWDSDGGTDEIRARYRELDQFIAGARHLAERDRTGDTAATLSRH